MKMRLAALLSLLLFLAVDARACSCAGNGATCGAIKPGGTMFLGEVMEARAIAVPMGFPGRSDLFTRNFVFRIRVLEAFAGGPKAGELVEIRTGGGGGDCGFGFTVGRRYLVDAYDLKPDNEIAGLRDVHLGTSICSRTQSEESAAILLKELRVALAHQRQPDLHGSVRALDSPYAYPGRPLPDIAVSLTAERDGAVYRTRTEADGTYSFAVLPPGAYLPNFILPEHQKLIRYNDTKPLRVLIPENDGTGLACHLDAQAGATGGVRVRVVDESGKVIGGSVAARLAESSPRENSYGSEWSDKGDFELEYLPDGDYILDFTNYLTHLRGSTSATVTGGAVTEGVVITAARFNP